MGLNPELRSVTIRVSYREIGEFAEAKLKEMFPEINFKIEDVIDDDEGIYFEYLVKGLDGVDNDIVPEASYDSYMLDDSQVRHNGIPEPDQQGEEEPGVDFVTTS